MTQDEFMAHDDSTRTVPFKKWSEVEGHLKTETDKELSHVLSTHGPEEIKRATDFYNDGARESISFLTHRHNSHPVHTALLLGYTSPAQEPEMNFDVTDRMLARGKGDILKIPPMNEPDFNNWVERLHSNAMVRIDSGVHGIKWWEKHGKHLQDEARNHPYYGIPAKWDGKKVHYLVFGYSAKRLAEAPKGSFRKGKEMYVPVTRAAKRGEIDHKSLKYVKVPKYSDAEDHDLSQYTGALIPSNWTLRGNTIRPALMAHQKLIDLMGNDGAAKWLTDQHDPSEVQDMMTKIGVTPKIEDLAYWKEIAPTVPGVSMFGPKVGSYVMNLLGHRQYLTADLWHSRNQAKHVGLSASTSAPPNGARPVWYRVLRDVAQRYGRSVADAQSLLWHHEQERHRKAGIPVEATSYRDGMKRVRTRDRLHAYPKELQKDIMSLVMANPEKRAARLSKLSPDKANRLLEILSDFS